MKAHILIVADGRSPTARSWIANIQALDYGVSLISTFPCQPPVELLHFHVFPVAFSRFSSNGTSGPVMINVRKQPSGLKRLVQHFTPLFQSLRYRLGPLTLRWYAGPYQRLVKEIKPDLVHALRIPFEGMLGSFTPSEIPFLTATWGNDLTLHARGSFLMRYYTRRCLTQAEGFTADTHRDVQLAYKWGLEPAAPTLVVPGSGGLDLKAIQQAENFDTVKYGIPQPGTWVVNPRGLRPGSVHQEVFIATIPKVLAKHPETVFICPNLGGVKQADAWMATYGIKSQTFLLPKLSQQDLWALFKEAQVFVSPSSHDGTPNTLLEAMACGCFPVAGKIEPLQEWIEDGVNGLLVDPRNPEELADAIVKALESPDLQRKAAKRNLEIIQNRAAQNATRPKIDDFYLKFL